MSISTDLLKELRGKDYLKNDVQIMMKIQREFIEGVNNLEFNFDNSYFTEVNKSIFDLVSRGLKKNGSPLKVDVISIDERKQVGAKLMLISSRFMWGILFERHRLKPFIAKVKRVEKIYKIRIYMEKSETNFRCS